ncbi:hypothetical protein [Deinococcus sp. 23YEL01]|uniref:hypothetical protein n=1 Tax=Deinococcus sp. 23YEL01 TaxID=2745871 RepID=UPI001E4F1EC2|nr:hypothetical protein [Deinococcus sp. 23YEL01]MCD0170757.1 hypothetical protein [Deinococcus sp. 23YEL01]
MAKSINSRSLQELQILSPTNSLTKNKIKFTISFENTSTNDLQDYAFRISYTSSDFKVPFTVYLRPSELGNNGKNINQWVGNLPSKGILKLELVYLGKVRLSWQELTYNLATEKAITLNVTATKSSALEVRKS